MATYAEQVRLEQAHDAAAKVVCEVIRSARVKIPSCLELSTEEYAESHIPGVLHHLVTLRQSALDRIYHFKK